VGESVVGTVSLWAPTDSTDSSATPSGGTISGNNANTAVAANPNRSSLTIAINGADVWIRLLPATTDPSVRKGIPVSAGQVWELPTSWWKKLYSGEVSIINAADGQTPTYYVTEL
jgi:hypothetical protein